MYHLASNIEYAVTSFNKSLEMIKAFDEQNRADFSQGCSDTFDECLRWINGIPDTFDRYHLLYPKVSGMLPEAINNTQIQVFEGVNKKLHEKLLECKDELTDTAGYLDILARQKGVIESLALASDDCAIRDGEIPSNSRHL